MASTQPSTPSITDEHLARMRVSPGVHPAHELRLVIDELIARRARSAKAKKAAGK